MKGWHIKKDDPASKIGTYDPGDSPWPIGGCRQITSSLANVSYKGAHNFTKYIKTHWDTAVNLQIAINKNPTAKIWHLPASVAYGSVLGCPIFAYSKQQG